MILISKGDNLASTILTQPANGTVVVNADGSFTYTPNLNYNGTDSFAYQVCDNGTPSGCGTGTVTILVNPVNDVPVFTLKSEPVTVNEDSGIITLDNWATGISDGDPELTPNANFQNNPMTIMSVLGAACHQCEWRTHLHYD